MVVGALLPVLAFSAKADGASAVMPQAQSPSGVIRITTNASGRATRAVMVKSMHPILDKAACEFALAYWHGPPNKTADLPVTVKIDSGGPSSVAGNAGGFTIQTIESTAQLVSGSHPTNAIDAKGVLHKGADTAEFHPGWRTGFSRWFPLIQHGRGSDIMKERYRPISRIDVGTGTVRKAVVTKSSGYAVLDGAAIAALRQWRWKPGKWKQIDLDVNFKLGGDAAPLPRGAVALPNPGK